MPTKSCATKPVALRSRGATLSDSEDLLRERACAKHLDISHRTLEAWRKQGLVPYLRITSKSIRYRLADVLQALQENFGQEVRK